MSTGSRLRCGSLSERKERSSRRVQEIKALGGEMQNNLHRNVLSLKTSVVVSNNAYHNNPLSRRWGVCFQGWNIALLKGDNNGNRQEDFTCSNYLLHMRR